MEKKINPFFLNLDIVLNLMMYFRKYSKLIEKATVRPTQNIQLSSYSLALVNIVNAVWVRFEQYMIQEKGKFSH